MSDLKYTSEHEWVRLEDDGVAAVGITPYAQDALGELVYVDLPQKGAELTAGDEVGVLESVKAASDIYAPVTGKVTEVNERLRDEPSLINASPESEGWIFRMRVANPEELDALLDEASYQLLIES